MVNLSFSYWIWASFVVSCDVMVVLESSMLERADRSAIDTAAELFTDLYRLLKVVSSGASPCSVMLYVL